MTVATNVDKLKNMMSWLMGQGFIFFFCVFGGFFCMVLFACLFVLVDEVMKERNNDIKAEWKS